MPNSPMAELEIDEAALLVAVQRGEVTAFEPLVDRHLASVRTFLSLKAPVPQLVDELAHDTFLFAYRHVNEFEAGTSFRAWLRAIAWNLLRAEILRYSRREARLQRLEDDWLLEPAVATQPSPLPDVEFLEECLEMLPDNSRTLIDLHYGDGLDSTEIAERLARSRAWVRTTLFRVRQQLKVCIESKRSLLTTR